MEKMTCKLRPDATICSNCLQKQMEVADITNSFIIIDMCATCPQYKNRRYDLIAVGVGFLGTKAVILKDGEPTTVPMWKIYDVQIGELPNN